MNDEQQKRMLRTMFEKKGLFKMSKINAINCSYFENTTKRNVSNIKNLWGVVARTNLDGLLVITYGLNVHFVRRLHRFQYTTTKIFNLAMCILI